MRDKFQNFYNVTKNTAYQAVKDYFEPLRKYPKTIIGASLIIAGIVLVYDINANELNSKVQNNFGLEKIIEIDK